MLKRSAFVFLAAGMTAALAAAQGRGPMNRGGTPPDPQTMIQRRVDFLTRQLGLTDAQKTQATTIFTNAYTASQAIQASAQTTRQGIADAVKKNDVATIDRLAVMAGNLSGQLTAIHSKAEAAFYAILTPDQQTKYDESPRGRGGFGGPMGPGGFGGPMGPGGFGAQRSRGPQ